MGLLDFLQVRNLFGLDTPVHKIKDPIGSDPLFQSAAWKYYDQKMRRAKDRLSKYRDYERMDEYELIASACDLYAEDCCPLDAEHNKTVWIESSNADVIRIAHTLFERVSMEEIITGITRKMIKYGDNFEAISFDSDSGSIIHLQSPYPAQISRVQEHGRLLGFNPGPSGEALDKDGMCKWKPWEILHFRMPSRERDWLYGDSVLYPAASAWEQLKMATDAMVVYRLQRAPDRLIYYVDVGNATSEEAYDIVNRWRKAIKKREYIDATGGDIKQSWNPQAADCFTGETRILLLDGTSISFREWTEQKPDKKLWLYSRSKDGRIVPGLGHSPRLATVKPTCIVKLDNGQEAECTLDHNWMLSDGTYCEAQNLKPGVSLAPLYRDRKRICHKGNLYETVMQPNGKWDYTHRVVADAVYPHLEGVEQQVVHHKDFNRFNNDPDNLVRMEKQDHFDLHSRTASEREATEAQREAARKNLTKYNKSDAHRKVAAETLRNAVNDKWENDPGFREMLRPHQQANGRKHAEVYNTTAKSREVGKRMAKENFTLYLTWKKMPKEFKKLHPYVEWKLNPVQPVNHKVVAVIMTNNVKPLYDITVDEHHNFALEIGVFVSNSDMFWPIREGSQSRVDKLPGSTNIGEITDVEYLRNNLFGALRIPKAFMGFDDNVSGGGLAGDSPLTTQSVRFAATIKNIRKSLITGLRRLVAIQMVYKRLDPRDDRNRFEICMSPISYLDDLMRSKIYQLRTQMTNDAITMGLNMGQFLNTHRWISWALRRFFRLSENEIELFVNNLPNDVQGPDQVGGDSDKLVQLVSSNPNNLSNLLEAYLHDAVKREMGSGAISDHYPDNWDLYPLPPMPGEQL